MSGNSDKSFKVILFKINNERYGVPINQVQSIEQVQPITRVPNAAEYVTGVMNLRGVIIPVIDIRRRFHRGTIEQTKETRIIIVRASDLQVGLMVESANEVLDISEDRVEKTPDIVGGSEAAYISGVAQITENGLLILLNLERVLSDEEFDALKQIKA